MNQTDQLAWIKNYYNSKNIKIQEINLIGIRNSLCIKDDVINDYIGYFTEDTIMLYPGTTEPSVYWTMDKAERNAAGTFHLSLGYHKDIWCIGTHKGYEAMVNDYKYCKPTRGWRDANYNFTNDASDVEVCDYFGINFHRMHPISIVNKIGKYSAGCQVFQKPADFNSVLSTIKKSKMYTNTKSKTTFSYNLFNIMELPLTFLK